MIRTNFTSCPAILSQLTAPRHQVAISLNIVDKPVAVRQIQFAVTLFWSWGWHWGWRWCWNRGWHRSCTHPVRDCGERSCLEFTVCSVAHGGNGTRSVCGGIGSNGLVLFVEVACGVFGAHRRVRSNNILVMARRTRLTCGKNGFVSIRRGPIFSNRARSVQIAFSDKMRFGLVATIRTLSARSREYL